MGSGGQRYGWLARHSTERMLHAVSRTVSRHPAPHPSHPAPDALK